MPAGLEAEPGGSGCWSIPGAPVSPSSTSPLASDGNRRRFLLENPIREVPRAAQPGVGGTGWGDSSDATLQGLSQRWQLFPAGKGCSLSLSQELLRWFKSGTPVTPHLLLANQGRAKPRVRESPGGSSVRTEPRRDLGMAHGWISEAWDGPARPPRAGCARAAAAA